MPGKIVTRTEKLDTLALNLYKHIQFAPRLINEKVQDFNYTNSTIYTYFMGMKHFVKTGNRNLKQAPNAFYDAIQEYMDKHVAQLTPKAEERAVPRGRYNRTQKSPVKVIKMEDTSYEKPSKGKIVISDKTMETLQNNGKVSSVGIKVGNGIKLFDNEYIMDGYIQCLNDFKGQIEDLSYEVIELSYKVKN